MAFIYFFVAAICITSAYLLVGDRVLFPRLTVAFILVGFGCPLFWEALVKIAHGEVFP